VIQCFDIQAGLRQEDIPFGNTRFQVAAAIRDNGECRTLKLKILSNFDTRRSNSVNSIPDYSEQTMIISIQQPRFFRTRFYRNLCYIEVAMLFRVCTICLSAYIEIFDPVTDDDDSRHVDPSLIGSLFIRNT